MPDCAAGIVAEDVQVHAEAADPLASLAARLRRDFVADLLSDRPPNPEFGGLVWVNPEQQLGRRETIAAEIEVEFLENTEGDACELEAAALEEAKLQAEIDARFEQGPPHLQEMLAKMAKDP